MHKGAAWLPSSAGHPIPGNLQWRPQAGMEIHAVFGIRATYCCHMRPVVLRRGEHLLVAASSARDQGHVKAANKCRSGRHPRDRWDGGRRQPKGPDVSIPCSTDSSSLSLHTCLTRAKVSTETSEGARLDSRSTFLSKLPRRLDRWKLPSTSTCLSTLSTHCDSSDGHLSMTFLEIC